MDKVRKLWLLIIIGNLFDYTVTLVLSYLGLLYMDRNFFIRYDTSFLDVLMTLTGEKLLLLSGVYWFSKLFDYLKISKYKWIGLLPFAIITMLLVGYIILGLIVIFLF
ncbi:hypothetical protein SSSV4_ORF107b [Sulfolobus spindle-shaped virus 4]|uniref:Conserved proviral protein n=3 Tax=root TaxID=1 RepID=F0NFS8_SACI5|nr:hypothetical protein [Sulfolobus islandicus]YP_001552210.1 hypothetical protein SSSV4_ORF107b [Sulfolobus spindle-shaped virus 4]YP_002221497.1 hypothetical protein SSSV5_gp32 [Sulfolobus spindle-shaped virus 5]ABV26219.1 hypothetical protein [Sulfolobus spindle-shaped virus 4]ABV26253.1 hypothetical protein [Sulfolobus spindle-shaped virus 5]ADX86464.1 conserved proviral protein [Sulfolobus islandicus REY15A]